MSVTLAPVPRRDRPVLAAMLDTYVAGFYPGRLCRPYRWLDTYWREPGRRAYLLRHDGAVAGFALLSRRGRVRPRPDCVLEEFTIVPSARRHGLGARAVHALWRRHPGRWEVTVARRAPWATNFWSRVIGGAGIAEHRYLVHGGRLIHRFTVGRLP